MYESSAERDFEERECSFDKWLKTRKVCAFCGEPIAEDKYYHIAGEDYCENCVDEMVAYQD